MFQNAQLRLAAVATACALALGPVFVVAAPASAVAVTSTSTLSHTCKGAQPHFVIGASATIPAGTAYTVSTSKAAYNLFTVRSDNPAFTTQRISTSQYRVTAIVPVNAGSVTTLGVSGFSIPTSGTTTNTISGDGQSHAVSWRNGHGDC